MARELACIDCDSILSNLSDLRNHKNFVHEIVKVLIECPTCRATFFKFLSYQRHEWMVHRKRVQGNKKFRISVERPATNKEWMAKVIDHLDLYGKKRCAWMKFLVYEFTGWRLKNGVIQLKVKWDKPWNKPRFQSWEPLTDLMIDCEQATRVYCLQKCLTIPKKQENARKGEILTPAFKSEKSEKKEASEKKEKREKLKKEMKKLSKDFEKVEI